MALLAAPVLSFITVLTGVGGLKGGLNFLLSNHGTLLLAECPQVHIWELRKGTISNSLAGHTDTITGEQMGWRGGGHHMLYRFQWFRGLRDAYNGDGDVQLAHTV